MKAKELRKLPKEELMKLKRDLNYEKIKASSVWGKSKAKSGDKEGRPITPKGFTMKGTNTSLLKDIRKNIAKINTILNERRMGIVWYTKVTN